MFPKRWFTFEHVLRGKEKEEMMTIELFCLSQVSVKTFLFQEVNRMGAFVDEKTKLKT